MLWLYLDTLKLGHKFCSMLSILNKLIIIANGIANLMTNNVYRSKKEKTQTTTIQIEPETFCAAV